MFIIYFLICVFFVLLYKQTKHLNTSLLATLLLLIFCQSFSLADIAVDTIALLSDVILTKAFLVLIIILILISCITEMILFLGQHHIIEDKITKRSTFVQKSYVHIISAFSTNVNFRSSDLVGKYNNIFDSSSFLMSSLTLISVPFLMIFFYFFPTLINFGNLTIVSLALIFTNYFAIFWFIKRIIDFRHNREREYNYHPHLLVMEDKHVKPINQRVLFSKFFIRAIIYGVIFIALIIMTPINVLIGSMIYLLAVFIDLFISIELFAYRYKLVREKDIYLRLYYATKKITNNLFTFIVGMLLITEATNLLKENTFYNNEGLILMVIAFAILSIIFTYYTSSFVTGLIVSIPILNIFMLNFPFANDYFSIVFILQGAILFTYFLSILHINFKDKVLMKELVYMGISGAVSYSLLIITSSYLIPFLSILVFLSYYYLRVKKAK